MRDVLPRHRDVERRWSDLGPRLAAAGADALLVSDRLNFTYLTGHLSREFEKRFRQLLFLLDAGGNAFALAPLNEAAALCRVAPSLKVVTYRARAARSDRSRSLHRRCAGPRRGDPWG